MTESGGYSSNSLLIKHCIGVVAGLVVSILFVFLIVQPGNDVSEQREHNVNVIDNTLSAGYPALEVQVIEPMSNILDDELRESVVDETKDDNRNSSFYFSYLKIPRSYTSFSYETYHSFWLISPPVAAMLFHYSFMNPNLSEDELLSILQTDDFQFRLSLGVKSYYDLDAIIFWERTSIGRTLEANELAEHIKSNDHAQLATESIKNHIETDVEGFLELNLAGICIPDIVDDYSFSLSDKGKAKCLNDLDTIIQMATNTEHRDYISSKISEFKAKHLDI